MNAVILAGENEEGYNAFGKSKALTELKGTPMIQYVIDALRLSGCVNKISVIGDVENLDPVIGKDVDMLIKQKNDIIDNLLEVVKYFEKQESILLATCDIPLIRGEMVRHFVEDAIKLEADICYPIVERSTHESKYKDIRRTFVSLREGDFTGGNLMLISTEAILRIHEPAKLIVQYRKNPVKMAGVLGIGFLIRLLFNKITIEEIEKYIQSRFGIKAKALITSYSEIGNDIDRIEDVYIFERYL